MNQKEWPDEETLLRDPTTSHWLRQQLLVSRKRDPVDALRDAEVLAATLHVRAQRAYDAACGLSGTPPDAGQGDGRRGAYGTSSVTSVVDS
jgi:hypothetical protein